MSSQNLDNMSLDELHKLAKDINKALVEKQKKDFDMAKAEIEAVSTKYGIPLGELVAGFKPKLLGIKKYANPHNPQQQWSGRGRKPRWFETALEGGMTEKEMLIE